MIPDFIANAGGVICAAAEYRGASEASALSEIQEKIAANTRAVLDAARSRRNLPRRAAVDLAVGRVKSAMRLRRWHGPV